MTLPHLTRRAFWTRVAVFGASLLVYAWALRFMARQHSLLGLALFSLLATLSLAKLLATLWLRHAARWRPGGN